MNEPTLPALCLDTVVLRQNVTRCRDSRTAKKKSRKTRQGRYHHHNEHTEQVKSYTWIYHGTH